MRTFFASAAVAAVVFAFTGCAATVDDVQAGSEEVESIESAASLSKFAKKLVGNYKTATEYPTLELRADKTYTIDTGARCVRAPCDVAGESGAWAVVTLRGIPHVELRKGRAVKTLKVTTQSTPMQLVGVTNIKGTFNQIPADVDTGANCRVALCPTNTQCVDKPGGGVECVPQVAGCAATTCLTGTTCVEDATGRGVCVPQVDACATVRCRSTAPRCVVLTNGSAACVPRDRVLCEAMSCIEGTTCIDGPTRSYCR